MLCHTTPDDWTPAAPNPFSTDGGYDGWSLLTLTAGLDERCPIGREPHTRVWHFGLGLANHDTPPRLADFLRYEAAQGRRVLVQAPSGTDVDSLVAAALAANPAGPVVRPTDARYLVHSTPRAAWPQIAAAGELRAVACLPDTVQIGKLLLEEPDDYGDYVNLGYLDRLGCEFVIASRQSGRMTCNEDAVYEPGVRLYFDAHRLITDGLAARDGVHPLKVRHRLPLQPYLLAAIGPHDVDPTGEVAVWTPATFVSRANARFGDQRK